MVIMIGTRRETAKFVRPKGSHKEHGWGFQLIANLQGGKSCIGKGGEVEDNTFLI